MATAPSLDDGSHFENQIVKCVIVGDTGVGKTRLICARACGTSYNLKQLMQTHAPTVWAIDHYRKDRDVNGKSWSLVDNMYVSLQLWDTFGYHDKDRKFAYAKADVVLLCYSVVRPRSLKNITRHWLPEIRHSSSGVPIILCGTQIDLRYLYIDPEFIKLDKGPFYREITDEDIITPDVGRSTANEIGAMAYYETSVLVPYGIEHAFENVIRVALTYKKEKHFWYMLNNSLKKVRKPQVQQPFLPPHPAIPKVEVPLDDWEKDMKQLFDDKTYSDLVFQTQNGLTFEVHKIIVATAVTGVHDLLAKYCPMQFSKAEQHSNPSKTRDATSSHTKTGHSKKGHSCMPESVHLLESEDSSASELSLAIETPEKQTVTDLDHPVFCSVKQQQRDPNNSSQITVLTVKRCVCPEAFHHVLMFMYTWKISDDVLASNEMVVKIHHVAKLLEFQQLLRYLMHVSTNEQYLNMNLTSTSIKIHQHKLLEYGLGEKHYSDVTFKVENGQVAAHKALLVSRSDMMACMFSNNFMESSAKMITFPGVTKHVFSSLLQYLYTGSLNQLGTSDLLEMMELANRLCLPRLQSVAEDIVIGQLQKMSESGQEIFEDTVMLLEPAQLHNARQLADYCMWYLTCNYLQLHKKHGKLKQSLRPDNQILLSQRRWPPVWYLKEYDYFEKCQVDLERQKQSTRRMVGFNRANADSPSHGCLGFCSRRRRKIKYTQRVEESVSV